MNNRDQYYIDLWNKILQYLIENNKYDATLLNNYFKDCYISEMTDSKVILVNPSTIIAVQIIQGELETIAAAFIDVLKLDHPITVEVYRPSDLEKINSQSTIPEPQFSFNEEEFSSMPIQPDRTFDNFVVGDCNRESQAAALACAYNPGKYFNPLFIYGNSGLGKTHLLMSIGNYVKKNYPDRKVYYIESLKFVDKVVKAIQNNKIDAFKQYMASMDVLLVDDIQFLAGKEKSHEVFFSIYNELVNNRKQICIASDRHPKDIKGLEDRLITRFSSGLSVGLDSPEFETSLAILRMKIQNSGNGIEDMDERGMEFIASNFSGNVRELEGALNRVLFYAIMFQEDKSMIQFETIVNALKNQTIVMDKDGLSPRKIIKCVADYYGLTTQQITGKSRTKNIANARHISIYLCRKLLNMPYIKIGDEFGGRDHATIISAVKKVENETKKTPSFNTAINEIEKLLSN